MKSLEMLIKKQRCYKDKFESYVCWTLLVGALLSLIPPTAVIVFEKEHIGCIGETFTVLGHYSMHEWLTNQFENFKIYISENKEELDINFDICYRLIIGESLFESKYKASLWVPETYIWINYAEYLNDNQPLINDTNTDCIELTQVPFGLITWKKLYPYIVKNVNQNQIPITDVIKLAKVGWQNYTNKEINQLYNNLNKLNFAMGHPNVTSAGLLTLLTSISEYSNVTNFGSFSFQSFDQLQEILPLQPLTYSVLKTAPLDYDILQTMISYGPRYIQIIAGFENDVANFNKMYYDTLQYTWNDTLQFIYLSKTFWMKHPLCILNKASWMNDNLIKLSNIFLKFINDQTRINKLLSNGIRPKNISNQLRQQIIDHNNNNNNSNVLDNILLDKYGVNISITDNYHYSNPTAKTVHSILYECQKIIPPIYLTILLDVSNDMSTSAGNDLVRWNAIPSALRQLPEVLDDGSHIDIICFAEHLKVGCPSSKTGQQFPSNGTLGDYRLQIGNYFQNSLTYLVGLKNTWTFHAINETYYYIKDIQQAFKNQNNNSRSNNKDGFVDEVHALNYHYAMLVITQEHSSNDPVLDYQLSDSIKFNFDPNEIGIYSILYWGNAESTTGKLLKELASKTDAQFDTANNNNLQEIVRRMAYFF